MLATLGSALAYLENPDAANDLIVQSVSDFNSGWVYDQANADYGVNKMRDEGLVANGADAMYEHHEEWHWTTGESAVLQFVTVHRVEGGKITLWKDYWDMAALALSTVPERAITCCTRRGTCCLRCWRPAA